MATKTKPIPFWQDIPFKGYFYASCGLNIAVILAIILLKNFLPPVTPLFYGRPEGATQLVPTIWLILAPFMALILTIVNVFLTKPVKDKLMQQILVVSTLLISVLTAVTILKIVFLVGFF